MQVRESITGAELRELVVAKFGRSYDTRLCQRRDRFNKLKMARGCLPLLPCPCGWADARRARFCAQYLQIMWKFVGQKSMPLSEEAYMEQLDAVAELLTEWGVVDEACAGITAATVQPKVDTVGVRDGVRLSLTFQCLTRREARTGDSGDDPAVGGGGAMNHVVNVCFTMCDSVHLSAQRAISFHRSAHPQRCPLRRMVRPPRHRRSPLPPLRAAARRS